jgi:hypothetical protein
MPFFENLRSHYPILSYRILAKYKVENRSPATFSPNLNIPSTLPSRCLGNLLLFHFRAWREKKDEKVVVSKQALCSVSSSAP